MTSPKLAQATRWGRMYSRERGGKVEVPSITTVLGVYDSEMGWWDALCASKETAEHAQEIAEAVNAARNPKEQKRIIRGFVDLYKDSAERDRDAAALRGDFVHDYIDVFAQRLMDRTTLADLNEHLEACRENGLQAYVDSFHRFWDKFSPTPLHPEATLWLGDSAGTTDLGCRINGVDVLIDWKTKKKVLEYQHYSDPEPARAKRGALQTTVGMQLSAAAHAKELWIPGEDPADDRWEEWTFRPDVGIAVAIGPDDYVARPFDIWHPRVWDAYVSLTKAWNWRWVQERVMGPDLGGPEEITATMLPSRRPALQLV
jgi:hypothetical protein